MRDWNNMQESGQKILNLNDHATHYQQYEVLLLLEAMSMLCMYIVAGMYIGLQICTIPLQRTSNRVLGKCIK